MNSIELEKMNNNKKSKHIPIRTCIGCRSKKEKQNLFRIVKQDEKVVFDKNQKINHRAIYLCKNRDCLEKFKKMTENKKLRSNIKIDLSDLNVIIEELKNELGE